VPSTVTSDGHRLVRNGTAPWTNATVDPDDPRVVYVFGGVGAPKASFCTPLPKATVTAQNVGQVTITVSTYVPDGPRPDPLACTGIGYAAKRLRVELAAPLGTRALVDGSTGQAQPVLDPSTVPTPSWVPGGYQSQPITWDQHSGLITHSYVVSPEINLVEEVDPTSAPLRGTLMVVQARPKVHGHQGVAWKDRGFPDMLALSWVDGTKRITLRSYGSPAAPLDVTTLVRIADSIR